MSVIRLTGDLLYVLPYNWLSVTRPHLLAAFSDPGQSSGESFGE
jgi:hypothetical protein